MNQSGNRATHSSVKRRSKYCDICGALLPGLRLFCTQCPPPEPVNLNSETGISISQASFQILILIILFIGVAAYKLELKPSSLFEDLKPNETPIKMAEDEDYKIFFNVNVSFANLRDQPNAKSSTILFVLTQGTQVEVLEQKNGWSRVRSKKMRGKESRTGWIASKLLDSEIK